jgi:hypothetical protein
MNSMDAINLYEDGKHRRYNLLFAVNGGAFALATFLVEKGLAGGASIVGGLRLDMLATGMAAFSVVLIYDIWAFGDRMSAKESGLFGRPGRVVLLLLGGLLAGAWGLVGFGGGSTPLP